MRDHRSPVRRYRSLTDHEWRWAIEQYELGYFNGVQLAAHFGMSKQGMSAGLIKRDAVKGCRAFELLTELNHQISRNQLAREVARDVVWRQAEARDAILAKAITALLAEAGIGPTELAKSGIFTV